MTPIELALALAIAQVCWNESGPDSHADCALIFQAVEAHGDTPGQRLDWLRRHSWTVFEGHHRGNARYSGSLSDDGAEPDGWPADGPPWSHYRERWHEIRKFCAALVMGTLVRRPCEGRVLTWGSRADARRALSRGLVPVRCEGTRNTGYALASSGGES
jgi:hypothetical protein